jgi:hypothetical protein
MASVKVQRDLNASDRRIISVGDDVEYRKRLGSISSEWDSAKLVGIEVFAPAVDEYLSTHSVFEYAEGDDIDLVVFHIEIREEGSGAVKRSAWGYWNQVQTR